MPISLTDQMFGKEKKSLTDQMFSQETPKSLTDQMFEQSEVSAPTTEVPIVKAPKADFLNSPLFKDTILGKEMSTYIKPSTKEVTWTDEDIITDEFKQGVLSSLKGYSELAKNPFEIVRGAGEFITSLPGFALGILGAGQRMAERMLRPFELEDLYNAASEGMAELTGYWNEKVTEPLLNKPSQASQMVGATAMAPALIIAQTGQELASWKRFEDSPNIRGALKFAGDIGGLLALGRIYKGDNAKATAKIEGVVREASDIKNMQEVVDTIPNEVIKLTQQKIIDAKKQQLELFAKEITKDLDYDTVIKEDMYRKAEEIAKAKTFPIEKTGLKKATEAQVKRNLGEVTEPKIIKSFKELEPEPITNLDLQTGTREPTTLSTENSPFRQPVEKTKLMTELYSEKGKAVQEDLDMFTMKLVNDVNRYLDGENVPIENVRNGLSELAARSEELRSNFDDPSMFENWKEVVSEAASWARKAERKVEPSIQLNMMIPLDQIPEAVKNILDKSKILFKDIFRNKEIFNKTGFWFGRDGKWRYEIDDSKARYHPIETRDKRFAENRPSAPIYVRDVLDYPELYKAIPDIADTQVLYESTRGTDLGNYSETTRTISIRNIDDKSTFFHELQHAVNAKTRAFRGSSPEAQAGPGVRDAFTRYMKVPGEMEARLAEHRMGMIAEQRRKIPPWNTLDRMLRYEGLLSQEDHGTDIGAGTKLYDIGGAVGEAIKQIKVVVEDISDRWGSKGVSVKHPDGSLFYFDKGKKYNIPIITSIGVESQGKRIGTALLNKALEKMKKDGHDRFYTNEITSDGIDFFDYQESLGKIKLLWEKEVPYDKDKPDQTYFERMYRIEKVPKPISLYDLGGAVGEGAKQVITGAKKVAEYTRAARGMKSFKPVQAAKMLKEELNRSFVDRSGNIRKRLLSELGNDGYEIVQKMYLSKGASSISANMLKQMQKEVYRGLNKNEKRILDNLILTDRMIDIGQYKTGKQFKFPDEIKPTNSIAYRELFEHIEKLSPDKADILRNRVKSYFEWMKKPLQDMLDSGLISEQEFKDLSSHNYRRLKLVDIYDKRYQAKVGNKKRTVYDSGIETLSRGRDTDIFEPSSEIMALEVFNRAYGRVLNNEANKTLLDLARKDKENPFVMVKEEKGDKIPSGWNRIFLYEKGQRKAIYLSPEMSKEWITNNPEMSYRLSQLIRYTSGSPVLRTFATGINWGFALANLPRDIMHIWFAARTFKDGKWEGVYSPHAPMFGLQIGRDLATVFIDAALRKGRYEDYINEGGGMEFLVHQGRLFQRGRHIEGNMDKVMNFLGYFGETSEVMTRLAIRERVLRKGGTPQEATFAARDYMDFGQGGSIAKALDNGIPYLNAAIQGTRGLFRAFKDSPLESTYKLSQFAALTTGLYIAMQKMHPKSSKALQGNIDDQNNLIIPLGDEFSFEDNEGQTRYPYIKIPLDPGQKFFKAFFKASADKWLGNEVDVDQLVDTLKQYSPVGTASDILPPTISGVFGYVTNKDFWLNEDIWRQSEPFSYPSSKEEYNKDTPQAFVDFGKFTGLSPERTKYLVEELTTNGTLWSYLLGQSYETAFGDLPKERKEQHLAMVLSKTPVFKRFIGVTNPYSKYGKGIDKAQEEKVLVDFVQNRNFDILVDGYLYGEGVSRNDVIKNAVQYKDREVYDRLIDRLKFEEGIKNLPEKSFWRRMKGLRLEAKAKVFVDRLQSSNEEEKKQLWKEYSIVSKAKGVISPEFREDVKRQMIK